MYLSSVQNSDTNVAAQERGLAGLPSGLSDTQQHKSSKVMEEAGEVGDWNNLWSQAYRTVKDDKGNSKLLESFEKYLRGVENGMYCEETHCNLRNFMVMKAPTHNTRS